MFSSNSSIIVSHWKQFQLPYQKKKLLKHLHNTSSFYSNRRLEQTPPQTCEDSFYPQRTPFSWWLTCHWTSTDLWRSRPFFDRYPPLVQIERFQSAPPALFLGPHSCPEGLNDVPLFLLFEFCPHFSLPHSIPECLPHKLKIRLFPPVTSNKSKLKGKNNWITLYTETAWLKIVKLTYPNNVLLYCPI